MPDHLNLKRRFRSSIRRGTGEAYLLIDKFPDVNFSDEITKACLKNFAYDGQCECSRACYLFDLILRSDRDKIRSKIIIALAAEQKDTWSLIQLFDLARLFAMQGDNEARQAIYDRFFDKPVNGSDWAGYSQIIDLDGIDGLLFIAEKIGRSLENGLDSWQDDFAIEYFQQNNPNIDAMQALKHAAKDNLNIQVYLKNIDQTEAKKIVKNKRVYDSIVDEVLQRKSRFMKICISDIDLDLLAQRLVNEKNKKNQEKLLLVFTRFKFPLGYQFILDIAQRKTTKNKKLVQLAIRALPFLAGEEIRTFSLTMAKKSKHPAIFFRILKSNYKEGDSEVLTSFAEKIIDVNCTESLAISYIDIYNTNKTSECRQPLEAIYNRLTCAIHRHDLVKILIENSVLSTQISEEIKFDCDEDTRSLANAI